MAAQPSLYERQEVVMNGSGWRQSMDDALALGLRSLSDKALCWTVTLAAIGLWTFCAVKPEFWRMITVSIYTAGVFLPMLWKAR